MKSNQMVNMCLFFHEQIMAKSIIKALYANQPLTRLVNADCPTFCGVSGIVASVKLTVISSLVVLIRASGYQQRYVGPILLGNTE